MANVGRRPTSVERSSPVVTPPIEWARVPSPENEATVASYDQRAALYKERTGPIKPSAVAWISRALPKPQTRIFEIGSGSGRDAAWLSAMGHVVQPSDRATAFFPYLDNPIRFDVVMDTIPPGFDLYLANAVLLHLPVRHCVATYLRICDDLPAGARFAFSLKHGQGEEWTEAKIEAPRFFCYWSLSRVNFLAAAHPSTRVLEVTPDYENGWIYTTVEKL